MQGSPFSTGEKESLRPITSQNFIIVRNNYLMGVNRSDNSISAVEILKKGRLKLLDHCQINSHHTVNTLASKLGLCICRNL